MQCRVLESPGETKFCGDGQIIKATKIAMMTTRSPRYVLTAKMSVRFAIQNVTSSKA